MCRGTGWGLWWAFLVFPGRLALLMGRHRQQKREQSATSEDEEQP